MGQSRRAGTTVALELSYQVGGVVDRAEYLRVTGATLARVLGGDSVAWNALDVATGAADVASFPEQPLSDSRLGELLVEHADDHPMVRSYLADVADTAPRRLSDLATRQELLRSPAYVEVLLQMGSRYQLTVLTARVSAASGRVWSVNRSGRDFTEADLETAALLQPMLGLLDRTFGRPPVPPAAAEVAERLGLTARELEVLRHVARGLTADAVARLLRISGRTVRKHLENAYRKLGRHDRLAAVQRAQELGLVAPARPL